MHACDSLVVANALILHKTQMLTDSVEINLFFFTKITSIINSNFKFERKLKS